MIVITRLHSTSLGILIRGAPDLTIEDNDRREWSSIAYEIESLDQWRRFCLTGHDRGGHF